MRRVVTVLACLGVLAAAGPPTAASPSVDEPSVDACGPRPAKPGGGLWSCTLDDDFTGNTLNRSLWTVSTHFVTGTPSAFACYVDDPSVVNVAGGSLNLSVRRVVTPVPCPAAGVGNSTSYVAGTVSTVGAFSQQYGRFEARIRATDTSDPGLHEAFWLWPEEQGLLPWPSSGEIDVSETYSVYPDRSYPYLHSTMDLLGARPGVNTATTCVAQRGAWNTYTLEWSPTLFEFFVNGAPCLVTGSGDAAFQKAYFPILTQALGQYADAYDGRAALPATMNVDYVRVWR